MRNHSPTAAAAKPDAAPTPSAQRGPNRSATQPSNGPEISGGNSVSDHVRAVQAADCVRSNTSSDNATAASWSPDPLKVPAPPLLFIFDKTFLSPARLIQFLALAMCVGGAYRYLPKLLAPVGAYLAMLGRNSLNVFCVASVLSLAAQILR